MVLFFYASESLKKKIENGHVFGSLTFSKMGTMGFEIEVDDDDVDLQEEITYTLHQFGCPWQTDEIKTTHRTRERRSV
jgi:hypothetical protein